MLEAKFGFAGEPPITINLPDGNVVRVRGAIDRMDLFENQVALVDYKSGSSSISKTEIQIGRNFQIMVYVYAARALLARHYPKLSFSRRDVLAYSLAETQRRNYIPKRS